MTNERFFRMLLVAMLGWAALAIVPDSRATDAQTAATVEAVNALPVEITVVREVEDINAGRFNPMTTDAQAADSFIASPLLTTMISQIDPNL